MKLRVFHRKLALTQWAVGDFPPLKEIPDEGAAAGEIFFYIKINDFFLMKFDIFIVFTGVFFD